MRLHRRSIRSLFAAIAGASISQTPLRSISLLSGVHAFSHTCTRSTAKRPIRHRATNTDVLADDSSDTATTFADDALPDSNRVFVGNLSPDTCKEDILCDSFGQFGAIADITLHGLWKRSVDNDDAEGSDKNKRKVVKPYAFVTFADASAATSALKFGGEDTATAPISGCVVKPAVSRKPRPKSNKRKMRAEERKQLVEYVSKEANVVLQCPKSHLHRLADYICQCYDNVEVLSEVDPGRRAVTLLLVKADDPAAFADKLLSVPYAAIAVNKLYILDGDRINGGTIDSNVADRALEKLARLRESTDEDVVVRVQAFPPKIRSQLIASMDSMWDEDHQLKGVDISPTGNTHTLSVVQIDMPKEYVADQGKDKHRGEIVHLLGLTPALPTDAITTHDRSRFHQASNGDRGNKDDSISRAYYKLQEAFGRFQFEDNLSLSLCKHLSGSVALDCGAAPGGWTKYLINEVHCSKVFSIDPGALDVAVESLVGAEHIRTTIENVIPILAERGVKIDLWVSDMCLHAMCDQVDWLLKAQNAGILSPTASFVLTLKCNIGHSAAAYEKQVEKEVLRLKGIATGIQTLHLFSNRSGERTVMGSLLNH